MRFVVLVLVIAVLAVVNSNHLRRRRPSRPSGGGLLGGGNYLPYPITSGGVDDYYPLPILTGGAGGRCGRTLNKGSCPLFDYRSNLVTREMFIEHVMGETQSGWILLLTIEEGSDNLGKCATIWDLPAHPEDDVFTRREFCYNNDKKICESFSEIMRIEEDSCGRVRLFGVNGTTTEAFYSQDITKYFWRELCFTKINDVCTGGSFMDLNVKGSRILNNPDRAPDLTGLPWDLIAGDLKNVFNKDIRDPNVRNSYLGEECPFLPNNNQ